mmetsp:Transcript_68196/g.112172  ORF Transcript_68196/g.112172 Transcript_68196/m.112172 type:complete len:309 (+) Transcript_68196:1440-2366(+)
MECSAFDILLTLALALHVTDAPPLFLPHQISRRVTNHPCAVCSTRTHTSTAISNHAIQAEELGVVVVQVIQLVLHLVEELRALSEANIGVQLHVIVEEVGDGGVEEIGLELMTSIANAVEARVVVPLIVVHVLRPVSIQAQIVLGEIQSSCFATTGSERNVVHEGVIILHTVHHLLGIGTKFQPILVLRIHWDLVVPSSWSNMLGLDGSLVFNGLGSGQVVHSEGQAVPIFGFPVSNVITVHVLLLLLFALQILLQHRQGLLQGLDRGGRHGAPAAFRAELLQGALATHSEHVLWLHILALSPIFHFG